MLYANATIFVVRLDFLERIEYTENIHKITGHFFMQFE